MSNWELFVSNIGMVLETSNGAEAIRDFYKWRDDSKGSHSRATGETVTLLRDGEIYCESDADYREDR